MNFKSDPVDEIWLPASSLGKLINLQSSKLDILEKHLKKKIIKLNNPYRDIEEAIASMRSTLKEMQMKQESIIKNIASLPVPSNEFNVCRSKCIHILK